MIPSDLDRAFSPITFMDQQNGGLPVLTLYDRRVSYFCQIVRLAAVEKGFHYQLIDVDYMSGATYEPDFVRINPACEIPVLKIGEDTICGSQEIIDHLDRLAHQGTDSEERPEIDVFRRRCLAFPVNEITLGVTRNPQLLELASLTPQFLEKLARRINRAAFIEEKILAYPELAEIYRAKLARVLHSEALISTVALLQNLLRGLDAFLGEVDLFLRTNANGNLQQERWLFGTEFTNADIVLACLLARVDFLGLAGKYWDETERLFLADYYRRLKRRPSFQQECVPHSLW